MSTIIQMLGTILLAVFVVVMVAFAAALVPAAINAAISEWRSLLDKWGLK